MADKKKGQIVIKVFETCTGEESESSSQLCTITVYGEGAAPLSKPHKYSFRAAAREKWVTFQGKKCFFLLEKNT